MSTSIDVLREAIEEAADMRNLRFGDEVEQTERTKAMRLAALNWLAVDRDDWKTLFLRENRSRLDSEVAREAAEAEVTTGELEGHVSDHAAIVREFIERRMPLGPFPPALAALDALVAERDEALEEREKWRAAVQQWRENYQRNDAEKYDALDTAHKAIARAEAAEAERDDFRFWNERVRTCEHHTQDVAAPVGDCLVCNLDAAEAELAEYKTGPAYQTVVDALRAAEKERDRWRAVACNVKDEHAEVVRLREALETWRDSLAAVAPNWAWIVKEIDAALAGKEACAVPGCGRQRTSDNRWCQECNEAAPPPPALAAEETT